MAQIVLIGISAGAATALLFASVASGSPLSILLFYLAPLPILIAGLGWSHLAALIAAVVASASLALIFGSFFFIAFLIGIGLPAWWLSYLALLARPGTNGAGTPGALEWYPVGFLVVWAAMLSAAIVVAAMLNFGFDQQSFQAALRSGLERMFRVPATGDVATPPAPGTADRSRLIDFMVIALPPAAAVLTTITSTVNLWLADKIVRVSGRSRRPPADLPEMRFPNYAPMLAAVAIAGSFIPGMIGIASGVLGAAMLIAYAILGFAVLHALTQGTNGRPFLLGGVYISVLVFGWPALIVALLGLAEAAFDFRARAARRRGPPPPPTLT
jgi:hypothetical protein